MRNVVDLSVPFSEKDEAKQLGARWNPERRIWYVPAGVDPGPFARWRGNVADKRLYPLTASEAYLVTASESCWRCDARFTAVAFLLAPGFVLDEHADGGEQLADWAFVDYITRLTPEAVRSAQTVQPAYRQGYSRTTESRYWANHCPSCQALQGDFHLYSEPDGAFWLADAADAARMQARPLQGGFGADGGLALGQEAAWRISGVRAQRSRPDRPPITEVATPSPAKPPASFLGWIKALGRRSKP
ncbi:DUF5710 domain-containing protein [Brevundimonas sp.]|uniref:DUF5710 domain-containing protein n=1 Tax=Brevundimonas sp. TaxID=1871086 RepID=UPI0028AECAA0|nr:DUF5710 domain-containing protein [Brevundimonas sp.]